MDVIALLQDYNIPFATEGHKHCRPGWVSIPCPFCTGNPGMHLGFNLTGNYFHCWRCGGKTMTYAFSQILNLPKDRVLEIIKHYGGTGVSRRVKEQRATININPFKLPSNAEELSEKHIQYLLSRGFSDPEKLIATWELKGTGIYSRLDKIDYSRRIIAPITWDGKWVSFQGRDITNKQEPKYRACPMARETIHHQHILYGHQHKWSSVGLLTEGITDVWKLGEKACACFGIDYTPKQLRVIGKSFDRGFVIFDDDPQAQIQAHKLIESLRFRYQKEWINVEIKGDPGALPEPEAQYLVKQLLKRTI